MAPSVTSPRFLGRAAIAAASAAMLGFGVLTGTTSTQAAMSQPCDIYADGGTPCVAAHNVTRAAIVDLSADC
ncbi:MAG: non-reducing end alpha-L-arabinofuranosidase [Actinomycetota bacterium]|nr:non-reducing end alpha-L-arabinofuranosidase [Actinomycetota bacterium]